MARRSSRRARVAPKKRELIWVSTVFQGRAFGVTTAEVPAPLVAAVDWARSTSNFERGCTLLAIRGWLSVVYSNTSTSTQPNWYMSIFKADEDQDHTALNWTVGAAYGSEDILYVDGGASLYGSMTPADATPQITDLGNIKLSRQIDIRTKRKLDTDEVIWCAFATPSAAQDWIVSGVLRCLLQLP